MKKSWTFICTQNLPGTQAQYTRLDAVVIGDALKITMQRGIRPTAKKAFETYTVQKFRQKSATDVILSTGNIVYSNFFSSCIRQIYKSLGLNSYSRGWDILPKG